MGINYWKLSVIMLCFSVSSNICYSCVVLVASVVVFGTEKCIKMVENHPQLFLPPEGGVRYLETVAYIR